MSVTGPDVEVALAPGGLELALTAAAEAATAALPSASGWSVQAAGDAGAALAALGKKPLAVTASLGGVTRLALAVTAALGRDVQVGPPPAEDLLDGLSPALSAAAAALGVELGAPAESSGPAALEPAPGEIVVAVLLVDGDRPAGVLALLAPAPAEEAAPPAASPVVSEHAFASLGDAPHAAARGPIDLLQEVEMGVTAELGRARMLVRHILELSPGSVIELDRAAGSPIDVLVNGTLIARGEVVVIDEEFGIRITEVVGYHDGTSSGAALGPGSPRNTPPRA